MRRTTLSWWVVITILIGACGTEPGLNGGDPGTVGRADAGTTGDSWLGEDDAKIPPKPPFKRDENDFVSLEPESTAGPSRGDYFGFGADLLTSADKGATEAPAAPNGRTEAVEEADIYRVDGDHLFYFNTYRGLLIYDIGDPKNPRLLSRVPVFGYPVEMFVEGGRAHILLRDVLTLQARKTGEFYFQRHNFSQIVAVDISKPESPQVGTKVRIDGLLREGVSRKVGNTVYVVSHVPASYYAGWSFDASNEERDEAVYVYSFDIAQGLRQVDKLEVFRGGSYWHRTEGGAYSSRYFNGVAIAATSNALMVVENWRQYGSSNRDAACLSSWRNEQQAVVSLVDISDPKGTIRRHAHFATRGHLTDQFKQTYFYDKVSGKATYLGIFARNEWTATACQSTRVVRNTLESWDVTDGTAPVKQDELLFGKPDETVRGSAFDVGRRVAYAITARAVDPLYAISFADPTKLIIRSEIDGLSGDMNVFRLVGENKYLIGIGRDTSAACSGTADNQRRATQVAVSLIDVRSLDAIRLVQRRCVTVDNAGWVNSQVNWNLDQAHKMIGMHSDGRVNVITVPISYSKKVDPQDGGWWWYRYETAVGVMSWAVGEKDSLTNHATVVHPNGQVRRSIVFTHKKGNAARRMMINLSDTHMSLVDMENLDRPEPLQVVELAPYYSQLFRFGDYLVEQVGSPSYYRSYGSQQSKTEFRVKRPVAGQPLEEAEVVASFSEGQVQSVSKVGTNLVLFRPFVGTDDVVDWQRSEALIYDMSKPASPRRAGQTTVPAQYPRYTFWCGTGGYWGGYWFGNWNNSVALSSALVFRQTRYDYDQPTRTQQISEKLVTLNLSDPDQPRVAEKALAPAEGESYLELVPDGTDPNAFYLSSRQVLETIDYLPPGEELPAGDPPAGVAAPVPQPVKMRRVAYYAQPWQMDASNDPVASDRMSVRGRLVRAFYHASQLKLLLSREDIYPYYPHYTDARVGIAPPVYQPPTARLHLHVDATNSAGERKAYWQSSVDFKDLYLSDLALNGNLLAVNGNRAQYYYYAPEEDRTQEDWSNRLFIYDLSALDFRETFGGPIGTHNMQLMGSHRGTFFFNLSGDGIMMADTDSSGAPVFRDFVRTLGWGTHIEFFDTRAFVAAGHFGIHEIVLK